MSLETELRRDLLEEVTLDRVLSALKQALKGKFESDKINKAIGELGNTKSWFESFKVRSPEDLLQMEWSGLLFDVGLPMSEEEVDCLVKSVVTSMRPEPEEVFSYQSLNSDDVIEPSGSAIDLVTVEDDILKVIEELKVEKDIISNEPEDTI